MVKPITEYSKEELEEKIVKIKAERERTAEALKKYEEELERRKSEEPLGVPLEDIMQAHVVGVYKYFFASESSKLVFDKWIKEYVKALQKLANGNQIDIKVLLPLLEKGKVAFCPNSRSWFWTNETPQLMDDTWGISGNFNWIGGFNIKPADDWRESLMECGL